MEDRIEKPESGGARIPELVAETGDAFDRLHDTLDAGFAGVRESIAQLKLAMEKRRAEAKAAAIEDWVWTLLISGGIFLIVAREFQWI